MDLYTENMNGRPYGATIPRKGRELIAKILAAKLPLTLTRIMVGTGMVPDGIFPGELNTVHMTVEYRSDLNGGLDHGFWIRELGIFAKDLDGSDVMLYYGTLGDYPQWVSAYTNNGGIDVRRYPVSITVGEAAQIIIDYSPEAFMTSEDVLALCTSTVLPMFLEQAQGLIDAHNGDANAHPAIQSNQAAIDARLSLLELMYNTDVSGNPFTFTFESLSGVTVSGVWNTAQSRIEF